jgi:hypothetical protein
LGLSLYDLSSQLFKNGHELEGLGIAKEMVEIYWSLAYDQPDSYNTNLTETLKDLSIYFYHFNCVEDALRTIEEVVALL